MGMLLHAQTELTARKVQEKAKSFMGSEFSYADMTPPAIEKFGYTFLQDTTIGEEPRVCYVWVNRPLYIPPIFAIFIKK